MNPFGTNCWTWLAGLWLTGATLGAFAANPFAARYERLFHEAQAVFQREPTNALAGWQMARACFDWSDFATNATQRGELAQLGISAARASIRLNPNLAPSHYYLGINLGQLADATRSLGGLKLVGEMEREFKKALELDAAWDYGGPDRCLGLLYRDAPGWPISVGSKSKARLHLEHACVVAKDYPDNQLNLLESLLKWGDKKKVAAQWPTTEKTMVTARQQLTGEAWASSWHDWDHRWKKLLGKTPEGSTAKTNP